MKRFPNRVYIALGLGLGLILALLWRWGGGLGAVRPRGGESEIERTPVLSADTPVSGEEGAISAGEGRARGEKEVEVRVPSPSDDATEPPNGRAHRASPDLERVDAPSEWHGRLQTEGPPATLAPEADVGDGQTVALPGEAIAEGTVPLTPPLFSTAQVWMRWETTLTSAYDYDNPYADVSLAVTFTGPAGQELGGFGFWDGGRDFKLRAMFPVTGTWTWVTTASDGDNAGLHRKSGAVVVEPYRGANELYRKGYLTVKPGSRYLTYGDGTPFLWIGDTAWAAPLNATLADWRTYVDDRQAKGFTVVQIDTCGRWGARIDPETGRRVYRDIEGNEPFFKSDLTQWNPAFWQGYDQKVQYANDQGLVVLVVGVMNPIRRGTTTDDKEGVLRFALSFAARMRGSFVVFSPGFDDEQLGTELADKVASEIERAADLHLITVHPDPDTLQHAMQYYDKPYLDFAALQTGRGAKGSEMLVALAARQAIEWPLAVYGERLVRPVINLEARYDGSFTQEQMPRLPRSCGYLSLLSGAAGYSYGSDGLWNWRPTGYDTMGLVQDRERWTWDEGLQRASSTDMRHMSEFLRSIEWWRLEPRHALIQNQVSDDAWKRKMVFAAAEAGDLGLAYLPDNARIELDMSAFSTPMLARWFDPSAGAYAGIAVKHNNYGIEGFDAPGAGDWLLVLTPAISDPP